MNDGVVRPALSRMLLTAAPPGTGPALTALKLTRATDDLQQRSAARPGARCQGRSKIDPVGGGSNFTRRRHPRCKSAAEVPAGGGRTLCRYRNARIGAAVRRHAIKPTLLLACRASLPTERERRAVGQTLASHPDRVRDDVLTLRPRARPRRYQICLFSTTFAALPGGARIVRSLHMSRFLQRA
jgi:hypothetical protein